MRRESPSYQYGLRIGQGQNVQQIQHRPAACPLSRHSELDDVLPPQQSPAAPIPVCWPALFLWPLLKKALDTRIQFAWGVANKEWN
ncbi:uncharacterized protein UV8b_07739 [Ustilaginoidea virens]|uniref:Uncharacterized protein n=1 Tax=Ustilaginoidea virens TaxID=1159556 RepID=A0A8E5HY85_USTVR|nr:uncharacterized protein UV8b_07739 [Ustilaginoidea virens]QUC23498.1 hypothetical protein UV8b_07739 [Ustilaginoidea virens]